MLGEVDVLCHIHLLLHRTIGWVPLGVIPMTKFQHKYQYIIRTKQTGTMEEVLPLTIEAKRVYGGEPGKEADIGYDIT